MLVWHRQLWLIDHGAALYFHHAWLGDSGARRANPFPLIRDHVLLPLRERASREVDAELAARLTPRVHRARSSRSSRTHGSPATPRPARPTQPRRLRSITSLRRLDAPRAFVKEAIRAHDRSTFDYAIVRVVPRVERGEFVNVGVIVSCPTPPTSSRRGSSSTRRASWRSTRLPTSKRSAPHLAAIAAVCAGGAGAGRSASCRRASASTGWSRRAAPSSRPRRCTPAGATSRRRCSITCSRRWSAGRGAPRARTRG